jgi:hypothetical protein
MYYITVYCKLKNVFVINTSVDSAHNKAVIEATVTEVKNDCGKENNSWSQLMMEGIAICYTYFFKNTYSTV